MNFKLSINMDNAAFEDSSEYFELNQIFNTILNKISDGETEGTTLDGNGNKVGTWSMK